MVGRVASLFVLVLAVVSVSARFKNASLHCEGECQMADPHAIGVNKVMPLKVVEFDYCRFSGQCPNNQQSISQENVCEQGQVTVHQHEDGMGAYACDKVDLLSYISNKDLGSKGEASDIWGATIDGRAIAIVGHSDGTSFVDIQDAESPIILGFLPTTDCGDEKNGVCSKNRIWRDIKVHQGLAFIVSENYGHGMQVVDLNKLMKESQGGEGGEGEGDDDDDGEGEGDDDDGPTILKADYLYEEFGRSHNIAINEESGYAYIIGSTTCRGGLHIVDVDNLDLDKGVVPTFVGCYAEDGYTHDCQCVIYSDHYPDTDFIGHEICFNYNEDTLTIVDVTKKDDIQLISRTPYRGVQYSHQGWLTEDGAYLLLDDELDEVEGSTYASNTSLFTNGARTRTLVWDVANLTNPKWSTTFFSEETVIDHNMYILDGLAYQSNYCGGLRVLDVTNPLAIFEHAFFDLAPYCDGPVFSGSWSNFPYYSDHPYNQGNHQLVAVSSIERGLYVLRVQKPNRS